MRRKKLALALVLVAPAFWSAAAAEQTAATSCADPALPAAILDGSSTLHAPAELRTVRVAASHRTLNLAVADTDQRREKGLMCVTGLRSDAGMIFVFASPGEYPFWMKDTLVPLDMIWIEADGRVTTIAAHVPASRLDTPDDKVAQRTGHGKFVIELRAGDAARAGINIGDRLALPELGAS